MTQLDELVSAAKSLDEVPPPETGARMWGNIAAKVAKVAGGAAVGVAVTTAGANSASAATAATSSLGLTLAKVGVAVAITTAIGGGVAAIAVAPADPAPTEPDVVVADEGRVPGSPPGGSGHAALDRAPERDEPLEDDVVVIERVEGEAAEPAERVGASAPKRPRARKRAQRASALADESVLLGKAKVAASRGRNAEALAAIRSHAAKFPHGELAEVRRALEVSVLCNLGRTAEAKKVADRFLARHRRSALAGQVRASCGYDEASE